MGSVDGAEPDRAVKTREVIGNALVGSGVDVLDQLGPGVGPVRLPDFGAVVIIAGREEQGAADIGETCRTVEVIDLLGPDFGPVGLPELSAAGGGSKGGEKKGAADVCEVPRE